jgi:hypothetical protein
MMEAYERDLNKYLDSQEQQEIAYLQFEAEVFDDIKELNEIDKQIEQLQEAYDNKLANLVDIARRYGSHEYDFTEDLMNLTKQI